MFETQKVIRILPVHIIYPQEPTDTSVNVGDEFESLINTLGAKVVGRVLQKLNKPHYATYIGRGKIDEIAKIVASAKVDVVVLDALVKPGQLHSLAYILEKDNPNIEVWDRADLILRIFDKHATTIEAKLQIDLARMNYMGPKIYGMGYVLSRQGGGIGTSGIGETNSELMRRHWRDQKKKLMDELKKIQKNRESQLDRRKEKGFQTVSIVGYTNAGKTSLFNVLTKKENLEKNELFATLDSAVGKVYLQDLGREILVSDTIGFIRNLPPMLISAFKSTLMESIHADMILHVIDASDTEMNAKIEVVRSILAELGITQNIVYVFNKIDAASNLDRTTILERYKAYSPIFISIKDNVGLEDVTKSIIAALG